MLLLETNWFEEAVLVIEPLAVAATLDERAEEKMEDEPWREEDREEGEG